MRTSASRSRLVTNAVSLRVLAPITCGYLLSVRDWMIHLESEPYIVAEHDRGVFAGGGKRLEAELRGRGDVFGTVTVEIPREGAFSATFLLRARTAGEAADMGSDVFLAALEEALRPLRFPLDSGLGTVTGIDAPVVAAVLARAHDHVEPPGPQNGEGDRFAETDNATTETVEINGYLVPAEVVHLLAVHLRALSGDWNGPAVKVALHLERSLEGGEERIHHVTGTEREAVCEALQSLISGDTERAFAEQLIVLLQGLAREADDQLDAETAQHENSA